MASVVPPVIIRASGRHTATLIFLHGLGDTGVGWAGAFNAIRPPFMKVICPTAPIIPVSVNMGYQMPAWYDILSLDETDPGKREDIDGVNAAQENLEGLIRSETTEEIPRSRIFVGGFSQGGAVALSAMIRSKKRFAGCIALSAYLPAGIRPAENIETPVLQVHGEVDEMVPFKRGKQTNEILAKYAKEIKFKSYPNMGHEGTMEEMELVKDFIMNHSKEEQ